MLSLAQKLGSRAWAGLLGVVLTCLMLVVVAQAQELDGFAPDPTTESDVGFLTRILQDSLSDRGRDVRIVGFEGALSSRATFERMTIADQNGVWLEVADAALQWNRRALLNRRIEISEISAARVTIFRAPVAQPSEELVPVRRFSLPELPVAIALGALKLDEVVIDAALMGQAVRAGISGTASLEAGAGDAVLQLDRLDNVAGRFLMQVAFANDTRLLSLDLLAEEAAGGLAVSVLGVPGAPEAALRIQGDGVIDNFDAQITLDTDGQRRVSGEFTLQTAQPGVSHAVRLDLNGDLRPLMQPVYHPFFGDDSRLRAQARRFEDGRLSLDDLRIQTNKLRLDGRARLGLDRLPELIDFRLNVRDPDGAAVLLPVSGGQTTIEQAELRLGFDAAISEDWDLVLDAIGFDNGDFSVATLFVNGLGRITSTGFGEDVDVVDALLDFSALGVTARDPGLNRALGRTVTGSVAFIWREDAPLLLPGVIIEGRDYTINGRARLQDGQVIGDGRAEFLDLARLSTLAGRDLGGAVRLDWDGTWGPERDDFALQANLSGQDLRADIPMLDRLLAGESSVGLDLRSDDGALTLTALTARAQSLTADLRGGFVDGIVTARGDLDFSNLSVLGAGLGGAVQTRLALDGPLGSEALVLDATARDLTVGGPPEVTRLLRGTTEISVQGTRNDLAFTLSKASVQNAALVLSAEGLLDAGASDLRADVTLRNLSLLRTDLAGAVTMSVSAREQGDLRYIALDARTRGLRAGPPAMAQLFAGETTLTARVQQGPAGVLVETARLSNAVLNAEITGKIADGRPDMRLQASLRDLAALVPGIVGAVTVTGTARDTGPAFALDLSLAGPAGFGAQATGSISKELQGDLRITGSTDLALISPRIEPRSVQGPAQFDLTLRGPLALSSVNGSAQVNNVQVIVPERNLRVVGMSGTAQIVAGQANVAVSGDIAAGGSVSLRGTVGLMPPLPADLRVSLTNVLIVEPQLMETQITGDLQISGGLVQGPAISGQLALTDTEIRIPRVGLRTRGYIPPDIVHSNDTESARLTRERAGIFRGESHGRIRRPTPLDLTIEAPNRIFVRGRGLDAELGGTLRLTGTSANLIPIGQFGLIRGRLDVLGNRFTLNEGFANLQGDLVPFVRLVASTERNGIIARIVLEGRADAPEIRFESVPELPEEEVVALLLFGRGLQTLSVFQAAQLASSLATLSGRSEGIMEKLRRNLGVDDLDVRTDEDGATSLRVGRYLTENIYTDIEVSPQGKSDVSINIDLSPSLTARGRVDNAGRSSVGLFFERDY
jgi:translocation and assembly module TamB